MQLKECTAFNFGSYKELTFNYSNLGLTLVYGTTGAGKSTLPDIAMWCLYGETAKDGTSDEVRAWGVRAATRVTLHVDNLYVTRVRGNSKENDLYWLEEGSNFVNRGKDNVETQRLLTGRLGIDSNTFGASCYFHEFSDTATFFVAKAKDRRALFSKVADLSLAELLSDRVAQNRKDIKLTVGKKENEYARIAGKIEQLADSRKSTSARLVAWKKEQAETLKRLEKSEQNFEADKEETLLNKNKYIIQENVAQQARISDLYAAINVNAKELAAYTLVEDTNCKDKICPTCAQPVYDLKVKDIRSRIDLQYTILNRARAGLLLELNSIERLKPKPLLVVDNSPNPYTVQLGIERFRPNPHQTVLKDTISALDKATHDAQTLELELKALNVHLNGLNRLYDLSYTLRSEMLKSAISSLQRHTNELLCKYFDAEITVNFSLQSLDSVEVTLQKNGHECTYKQLSRGQRAMLRLCFVVAVQEAVSNASGVHIDTRFYDEVLDGLSESLKVRAFDLFQSLSLNHSSVVLIDHSQTFQNLFDNKFEVVLHNNESTIHGQ